MAALAAAGVPKAPRPFHDLRHTVIKNEAAAGSSPIAVMAKAGHANMSTTQRHCITPASCPDRRPTRLNGGF